MLDQVMINTYLPKIMNLISQTFYNNKRTNTKDNKNIINKKNKEMKKKFVMKLMNQKQ